MTAGTGNRGTASPWIASPVSHLRQASTARIVALLLAQAMSAKSATFIKNGGAKLSLEVIRVMVVDADPGGGLALAARLGEIEGIDVVGLAHSRNAAKAEAENLEPDVLLIDVMLPGYRSIDIVRQTAAEQLQIHVLALAPADPTHDRIMLAAEPGALGYVCRDADLSEFRAAIEQVHQGEP